MNAAGLLLELPFPGNWIAAVAWVGLILAAARGLGLATWKLLWRAETPPALPRLVRWAVPTALGLGLAGQVWFWLALAGCFTLPVILLTMAAGIAANLWPDRTPAPAPAPPGGIARLWLGVAVAATLIPLALCFLPELNFDALRTHLWLARELAASGWMPSEPSNWNVYIPNAVAVLFGAGHLLGSETAAKLIQFSLGLLIPPLAGLLAGGKPGSGRSAAFAAAWFSLPVAAWEMCTAYVDLGSTLFLFAALAGLARWRREPAAGWLRLAALAFGLACTMKYNALLWLPPALAVILWTNRKNGIPWKTGLQRLGLFLVPAVLLLLPWLGRNLAETGNPLFPLPVPGFHSALMTPEIVANVRAEQASFGFGRSGAALLALPWNLLRHPEAFRGSPGLLLFPALALALFFRRRLGPDDRLMLLPIGFGLLAWFFTSQEIRYLLPVLPPAAWLMTWPLAAGGPWPRWPRYAWSVLLAGQLLFQAPWIYSRVHPGVAFQNRLGAAELAVLTGQRSDEDYRRRHHPFFGVYDWASRNLSPPVRVLSFDAAAYWCRWPMLYAFSVEGGFAGQEHDPDRLLQRCARSGLTHVVVNQDWLTPDLDQDKVSEFFKPAFQARHLRLLYREGPVGLFAIGATGREAAAFRP